MDVREHNRSAWNEEVTRGNRWTVPVGPEEVAEARAGRWRIVLTPTKPVPREWFPELPGADLLCLASGGGQQGPILAAAGARVTVLDNSPRQLERDRDVATREGLAITTVEGDMARLGPFADESFDVIVHPVSNVFVPELAPVWREAFRVLRPGGVMLSGFTNPDIYLFDYELADRTGVLQVKYALPYSDLESLDETERARLIEENEPLEFSHTFEEQIGSQLAAGFVLTHLFEDSWDEESDQPVARWMSGFLATRALKPAR
jgi:SAM-dependent methyltransferase